MGEQASNIKGIVKAVCISKEKGTPKADVGQGALIPDFGIESDAHAGSGDRQVSLLSFDKVEEFRQRGAQVANGAFGENILAEHIDFKALPVGTKLLIGDAVLEISQIGKQCHSHCAIYDQLGDCIMPREGVFARVLKGGIIKNGDEMHVEYV